MGLFEIPYFGSEDQFMDKNGKTGRRHSALEEAAAERIVRVHSARLEEGLGTA